MKVPVHLLREPGARTADGTDGKDYLTQALAYRQGVTRCAEGACRPYVALGLLRLVRYSRAQIAPFASI